MLYAKPSVIELAVIACLAIPEILNLTVVESLRNQVGLKLFFVWVVCQCNFLS